MLAGALAGRRSLLLSMLLGLGCNGGKITEASDTSSSTGESGDACPSGSLGCECNPGGVCEIGLECMAGVCAESDETETGECSELGCACIDDEGCDEGLWCFEGSCIVDECGDGNLDLGELCDDANVIEGDGCDNDCSRTQVLELALGGVHSCALIEQGRIRCWGHNGGGQLGYGVIADIGVGSPGTELEFAL